MLDKGKRCVLGVDVNVIDYEGAVERIIRAACANDPLAVSALAVHGVMTGVRDLTHRYRLNHLDIVTPDGQPVRWALRLLHGQKLRSRVYGPELMLRICAVAAAKGIPIYFYGSRQHVLDRLAERIKARFPQIIVAGSSPSRFRRIESQENMEILDQIQMSGAKIVFVGLGCPKQEIWAYENTARLSMPVIAVGAAFDYHAELLKKPKAWMQDAGLEWLHRLVQEPKRLWRRYLVLNSLFCWYIFLQVCRFREFSSRDDRKPDSLLYFA